MLAKKSNISYTIYSYEEVYCFIFCFHVNCPEGTFDGTNITGEGTVTVESDGAREHDLYIINGLTGTPEYDYYIGTSSTATTVNQFSATYNMTTNRTINIYIYQRYEVSYNPNGGSGSMSLSYKRHGTDLTLSANTFTRTSYVFAGWATSASGSVVYQDKGRYTSNADDVLYAVWEKQVYTITLDKQSGTGGTSTIYLWYKSGWYSNSAVTTKITSITRPTRTGYTFQGYYTGTNGSGTQIINSSGSIVGSNSYIAANDILYASWKPNIYTITFNKQSGSGGTSTIYLKYNAGWYSNSGATTSITSISIPFRE